jgi:ligand-binding sensor domain-containing protein
MKIHTKIWGTILLCLLTLAGPLRAQNGKFYSTDHGLSSSLINHLLQDDRGYVWIATEYGLNRFDGIQFTTYYHNEKDSTSLTSN